MLEIDGSWGEGGGQVLRSSLSLSLITKQPFRIFNIRSKRHEPGLRKQHLTAVEAAVRVGQAQVTGAELGSQELSFIPEAIYPGDYHFAIGSAGSTTLVLQTILPALMIADAPSSILLEGGTHNPFAPPFDFLSKVFLPLINRMGPMVTTTFEHYGFYPAGGGRFQIDIEPAVELRKIDLPERGAIRNQNIIAIVANLPLHIAAREIKVIKERFRKGSLNYQLEELKNVRGQGNVIVIETECQHLTELFTGFGQSGLPAEKVADTIANEVREYINANVPVGRYLADQLLIPMAVAGGGSFKTLTPSQHTLTNIEIIRQFLDIQILVENVTEGVVFIKLKR